jgi:hypothetical protein
MRHTVGTIISISKLRDSGNRFTASVVAFGILFTCIVLTSTAAATEEKAPIAIPKDQLPFTFVGRDFFTGKIVYSRPPGDLPGQYPMDHVYPVCKGEKDFDCIMNVEFINKDGKKVSGKFVGYIPVGPKGHGAGSYKETRWEASKPPYFYPTEDEVLVKEDVKRKIPDGSRSSIWTFPGLAHSDGNKYLVSAITNTAVTNQEEPNAAGSVADWRDSNTLLSITPIKVDNDTSGLEITREVYEKSPDGKTTVTTTEDLLSKFGYADNGNKVCYVSLDKNKPNCFSEANDSEYPRFKITLRLKLTEEFLTLRHWFMARASGIEINSKKEPESSIVTFEGTTIQVPKATALLPRTIEGFKIYQAAINRSYADSGVTNKPLDLNDLSGFAFWQNLGSAGMQEIDPGTLAFWSAIEPFAKVLVDSKNPTWLFETANISGRDTGWLWPCVKKPHVSGVVASNASIMRPSPPRWNTEKQTLEFRIASPHLNQDGSVATGFYNLAVSQEVANCLWGIDVSKARAEVSITSEAGEKKIFVSATSFSDGYFNFQASGFTYSVNTVSLKFIQNAITNATIKPTSPQEIVCKKGKTTKKFKTKKCPAGFVKK